MVGKGSFRQAIPVFASFRRQACGEAPTRPNEKNNRKNFELRRACDYAREEPQNRKDSRGMS